MAPYQRSRRNRLQRPKDHTFATAPQQELMNPMRQNLIVEYTPGLSRNPSHVSIYSPVNHIQTQILPLRCLPPREDETTAIQLQAEPRGAQTDIPQQTEIESQKELEYERGIDMENRGIAEMNDKMVLVEASGSTQFPEAFRMNTTAPDLQVPPKMSRITMKLGPAPFKLKANLLKNHFVAFGQRYASRPSQIVKCASGGDKHKGYHAYVTFANERDFDACFQLDSDDDEKDCFTRHEIKGVMVKVERAKELTKKLVKKHTAPHVTP